MSWRQAFRTPLSIAPLGGKYYSTKIVDANGEIVIELSNRNDRAEDWTPILSARQHESVQDLSKEDLIDWSSDGHWEAKAVFELAEIIVAAVNKAGASA
jgi:hypothetical protein